MAQTRNSQTPPLGHGFTVRRLVSLAVVGLALIALTATMKGQGFFESPVKTGMLIAGIIAVVWLFFFKKRRA
jgi:hypothetical protein